MKGKVIDYGRRGDPVVGPEDGSKLVILRQYRELPTIGAYIDFSLSESNGHRFGKLNKIYPAQDKILKALHQAQKEWKDYAPNSSEQAQTFIPMEFDEIRKEYAKKHYVHAAKQVSKTSEWISGMEPHNQQLKGIAKKLQSVERMLENKTTLESISQR